MTDVNVIINQVLDVIFKIIERAISYNAIARLPIPTEAKIIFVVSLAICIMSGFIKGAWRFLKVIIVVGVLYLGATSLGII